MRVARLFTLLLAGGVALPLHALTADELVEKNIAARGGREKLAAIKSTRATGKSIMGGDDGTIEMVSTLVVERGGKLRQERTMQGLTSITAIDGDVAWSLNPFGGRREPVLLPPDAVKSLKVEADIDGPLVDYKAKGHKIEYLGTEDVDGTEAHKLRVALANGDEQIVYLDPDYFLQIRERTREKTRGVENESETDIGNYELVEGVYMPFSFEIGQPGGYRYFKINVEKIEVNTEVDDALFKVPGEAAAPAGKEGSR